MADPTPVATVATSVPTPSDISRAESFTREAFVHAGETTEDALGRGTARRRALDAALLEIDAGAKVPSPEWRRRYSLMLGLERVLSDDEPKLADGTSLNPHQVDALSGTLTALLAEAQRNGGTPLVASAAPVLAVDDEPEDYDDDEPVQAVVEEDDEELNGDDDDDDDEPEDLDAARHRDRHRRRRGRRGRARGGARRGRAGGPLDEDQLDEAPDDPNAHKRFWFEHATGAGKTVAAMGFVDASRTGGVLILTHRRNLVDQFHGELKDRGYAKRITPALLQGKDNANGPVTVETYQWFVRNAGKISEAYSIVICDEAHTALGEKTSAAIRKWTGPIFIGMTATGALIARHVTDLFPTQTSRFDLAQAARRGVISPLRCVRIPPGPGVRTIAKVPLRRGEVDAEFDQEMLAELLDQGPFNFAAADLYKTRFNGVPGRRLRRRRQARLQPRRGVPRAGRQGDGGLRRDAQARARGDPRALRARRHRRARQRAAARRGLELAARDGLHAPRADGLQAHLPAARRPRDAPQPRQGGRHRRRLRRAGHEERRPRRDAALAAGPRRLPRRRDRRRAGAPRPRAAAARRAPRAAGDERRGPPDRGLRARAVADRRRAPALRRADPVGRAGRRARRAVAAGGARGRCCTSIARARSSAPSC